MENKKRTIDGHAKDTMKVLADQAKLTFDTANKALETARVSAAAEWNYKFEYDKSIETTCPFEELINMLEWYIKDMKTKYAEYLKASHIKLDKESKEIMEDIDKNKPAKVIFAKQLKQLKMGE